VVPLFYREYLRGGGSAAALRSAKLALFDRTIAIRDSVRLSLAHPFLWANYVLYHFYR
jgi:CHAT domain-containing protein